MSKHIRIAFYSLTIAAVVVGIFYGPGVGFAGMGVVALGFFLVRHFERVAAAERETIDSR